MTARRRWIRMTIDAGQVETQPRNHETPGPNASRIALGVVLSLTSVAPDSWQNCHPRIEFEFPVAPEVQRIGRML